MQTLSSYGLTDRDSQIIFGIFKNYSEVKNVLIFGSRAKGVFHKGSDIDLAIDNSDISFRTLREIKHDFEESSLPYNVDLFDIKTLNKMELTEHIKRVGKSILSI